MYQNIQIRYGAFFILLNLFLTTHPQNSSGQSYGITIDREGNKYKTVVIGNKTWMAENLRVTKFNDGTAIAEIKEKSAWNVMTAPGYCWYNNDTSNKKTYGALYNAYTINTNKLCPAGWHVSTDADWTELVDLLGGKDAAGAKLKESGNTHWSDPGSGATNESGFTALPGGTRYANGIFFTQKEIGYWWTFTGKTVLNGWYRSMYYSNNIVDKNFHDSTDGFSVRCVKD